MRRRPSPSANDNAAHLVKAAADFLRLAPHAKLQPFGEINGNAKHPLAKGGYATATNDMAEIERMVANPKCTGFGAYLNPADGLIVVDIDVDPKKGKNGVEQLEALAAVLGDKFPLSAFVESPSGHGSGHVYLRVPAGVTVPSSNGKIAPGIDVRGNDGSYWFAIPGSQNRHGEYKWKRGREHLIDAPQWLVDAAKAAGPRRERKGADADVRLIEEDLPEHVAKAREWLKTKARPAIEGQGGDQTTYDAACMLWSFGLSEATALELMLEVYNPLCQPDWEPDSMELKVRNAYEYHTSAFGNCTDAYRRAKALATFKAIEAPSPTGRAITAGHFRVLDRDAMDSIKPPKFLYGDMIPEGGDVWLAAPQSHFKTFLALDIANRIALGLAPLFGGEPCEAGPVAMLIGEGRENLIKRQRAWEQQYNGGHKVADIVLADPVPNVAEGEAAWNGLVGALLAMRPDGYRLVVMDGVTRAMAGVNENAQEHASKYSQLVALLQRRLGCAVLSLAHTGHDAQDRARGSAVFGNNADTVLVAERNGDPNAITLKMVKQKDAAPWREPRTLAVEEIRLPDGSTSLVMVKPSAQQERATKAAATIRSDTPLSRDANALYLLKALRQGWQGRFSWSNVKLAVKAREYGCPASIKTLTDALGRKKGVEGWARSHPWLKDYYQQPSETWVTPRAADMPPMPPGVDIDRMAMAGASNIVPLFQPVGATP